MGQRHANKEVNEIERLLLQAEAAVEKAGMMLCFDPGNTPGGEMWRRCTRLATDIGDVIHMAYMLRPEEEDPEGEPPAEGPNPAEGFKPEELQRALWRHKDVLAAKIWVRKDIDLTLGPDDIDRLGQPTPEDIDAVMEDEDLKDYLQDCQDSEWDSIRESLVTAMERRKANEKEN